MAPERLKVPGSVRESDLRLIWSRGLFRRDGLLTEDSRRLTIDFPGMPSLMGPDFRQARISIEGAPVSGDVELHLLTSGWRTHRHRENLEYAGVRLHVALWRDPGRPPAACDGGAIPELVLEPYLQRPLVELLALIQQRYPDDPGVAADLQALGRLLDAAGDEWLLARIRRFERLCRLLPPEEALHREFMAALGYSANKSQFEQLATLVPSASVSGKSADEIEGLLLERGASILWRRREIRPSNTPERRIHAAALVLARCPQGLTPVLTRAAREGLPRGVGALVRFLTECSIGPERAGAIAFNVVLPFLIVRAKDTQEYELAQDLRSLFSNCPAPADNRVTRWMKDQLFGAARREEADRALGTMKRHLGLIHWYHGARG
jgi:hypothetical protein